MTSKSFILSFTFASILCIMDIAIFGLAKLYGVNLPYGSALSYGTIIGLYSMCVIESLGLSLLLKFSKMAEAHWKNII